VRRSKRPSKKLVSRGFKREKGKTNKKKKSILIAAKADGDRVKSHYSHLESRGRDCGLRRSRENDAASGAKCTASRGPVFTRKGKNRAPAISRRS